MRCMHVKLSHALIGQLAFPEGKRRRAGSGQEAREQGLMEGEAERRKQKLPLSHWLFWDKL